MVGLRFSLLKPVFCFRFVFSFSACRSLGIKGAAIAKNNGGGENPRTFFAGLRKKDGKMKKQSFLKGAATIAVGGFIAKLIGALYRIPLTNIIGGYGMGLYQMVYPFYCLLLTVSATGIPSSIAKMVAEKRARGISSQSLLKSSFVLFLSIGALGTLLMMALSPLLSRAQDCPEVKNGYLALAPSVLLVSAISVFRGWFQGENNMFPTALSEVTEQVVKVGF